MISLYARMCKSEFPAGGNKKKKTKNKEIYPTFGTSLMLFFSEMLKELLIFAHSTTAEVL